MYGSRNTCHPPLSLCVRPVQCGRLELFSLEGLAAQAADADTEASGSLCTLEVPDEQVRPQTTGPSRDTSLARLRCLHVQHQSQLLAPYILVTQGSCRSSPIHNHCSPSNHPLPACLCALLCPTSWVCHCCRCAVLPHLSRSPTCCWAAGVGRCRWQRWSTPAGMQSLLRGKSGPCSCGSTPVECGC